MDETIIKTGNPAELAVRALLDELDAYLLALYPAEANYIDDVDTLTRPNVRFAVASRSGNPVGCGAVKLLHDAHSGEDYGEIKRVFVSSTARGQGIARRILDWLEDAARCAGAAWTRLETGDQQPEALALYEHHDYVYREAFGVYRKDHAPLSLFMEKSLFGRAQVTGCQLPSVPKYSAPSSR